MQPKDIHVNLFVISTIYLAIHKSLMSFTTITIIPIPPPQPQICICKSMESLIIFFVFSLLLTVWISDASKPSIPHISVVGVVYCDACSNNSFSHHSYFLPGAEVRIDCRFNAASPRTAEQISFTVNRTTNRHGVYKMDIPSVDGFNCAKEASILNTCRASLIRSRSPDCNVPASVTTSNQFSVKSKQANLCVYSLYALSFRPSKKDIAICGK